MRLRQGDLVEVECLADVVAEAVESLEKVGVMAREAAAPSRSSMCTGTSSLSGSMEPIWACKQLGDKKDD